MSSAFIILSLYSCLKTEQTTFPITDAELVKIECPPSFRTDANEFDQAISFSGIATHEPDKIFSGSFELQNLETIANGSLYLDGKIYQNAIVELQEDYLGNIEIIKSSNNSYIYTNIFEGQSVTIEDIIETENTIQGTLKTLSGEFDFSVKLNSSARAIPVLVWAIAAGISTVTTAVSCTVMRATAQAGCENAYHSCLNTCPSQQCSYSYTGGMCGGDCHVNCNH